MSYQITFWGKSIDTGGLFFLVDFWVLFCFRFLGDFVSLLGGFLFVVCLFLFWFV